MPGITKKNLYVENVDTFFSEIYSMRKFYNSIFMKVTTWNMENESYSYEILNKDQFVGDFFHNLLTSATFEGCLVPENQIFDKYDFDETNYEFCKKEQEEIISSYVGFLYDQFIEYTKSMKEETINELLR